MLHFLLFHTAKSYSGHKNKTWWQKQNSGIREAGNESNVGEKNTKEGGKKAIMVTIVLKGDKKAILVKIIKEVSKKSNSGQC